MDTDPIYLDVSFENVGIRDSLKRLKGLITDVAIDPLREHHDVFAENFDLVEEVVSKRVATTIGYWCQNKHDPVKPNINDQMGDITNTGKSKKDTNMSLKEFYISQVKDALHSLAPDFNIDVPNPYSISTDELEFALLEVEESLEHQGVISSSFSNSTLYNAALDAEDEDDEYYLEEDDEIGDEEDDIEDEPEEDIDIYAASRQTQEAEIDFDAFEEDESLAALANLVQGDKTTNATAAQPHTEIVPTQEQPPEEINLDVISLTAEEAWHNIYNMMGYESDYIQKQMLPRWKQSPENFEKDRRFLYNVFVQSIRNASGLRVIAGNFWFEDRRMTVDQLWQYYYRDLAQNVGPQLSVAQLEAAINDPWYKKAYQTLVSMLKRVSPIWMLALVIALVFDGLTTYVSLDQTPMDGLMVWVFTVLITALFQIADMLVINYRQREFESDALIAKYKAQDEKLTTTLEGLDTTSESFVQLSMERSQAKANWKAAEDNRKMARRGRFWSARIADINVVVTAYGFAYLFLNAEEPMYALVQQIDYIVMQQAWNQVNLWVFLMIGLAITVSFVINTAQRTEILGWSMRRLKNEA